jgi:hypothetical protein
MYFHVIWYIVTVVSDLLFPAEFLDVFHYRSVCERNTFDVLQPHDGKYP